MLFNKDNNGSKELFEISGTFQASTPFNAITTEISSAIDIISGIVGAGIVSRAEIIYESSNVPEGDDAILLELVRRPVAFLAICNYSKITGLSHGASGRKMTVGDNEKIPFEWMIDRDDREMRERYYRALDSLFSYLTSKNTEEWKQSDAYKALSDSLIQNLAQFEQVYPVNHSQYTFFTILPLLVEAKNKLEEIIGSDKMAEIMAGSCPATTPKARKYTALTALVTALKRWSISIFPIEVARQFAPSYQGNKENRPATKEEIEWAIDNLSKQAAEAQAEVICDISGNPYKGFPLIPENDPKNKYFTV